MRQLDLEVANGIGQVKGGGVKPIVRPYAQLAIVQLNHVIQRNGRVINLMIDIEARGTGKHLPAGGNAFHAGDGAIGADGDRHERIGERHAVRLRREDKLAQGIRAAIVIGVT